MVRNIEPRLYDINNILRDYEDRLRFLERITLPLVGDIPGGYDTGWFTPTYTVNPPGTVSVITARRIGNIVSLAINGTYDVTAPTNGNVANTDICTITTAHIVPSGAPEEQFLGNGEAGRVQNFAIRPDGIFRITALAPTSTWGASQNLTGESFSARGVYFL